MRTPPRWGILGTASIADQIIRGIREGGVSEVWAVASRDLNRAREWGRAREIPLAFGAYDELLRSGEVDLIYNPLPNSLHAEWTIRALEAGLPVLCEKPLTANAAEARAVAEAAARTGLPVAEGFMYRFHPQWSEVFSLLRAGAVGTISTLFSRFTFRLDDPAAVAGSADLAGGALMDVGCYCVHFSRWVAGCEPRTVSAFERREGVDRTLVGLFDFPNGVLAQFETSIANFERHGAEIAGEEGSLVIESPWIPGDLPARVVLRRHDTPEKQIVIPPANSYRLEVDDFVAASTGKNHSLPNTYNSVANMVAIDALFAAARGKSDVIPSSW